MSRYISESTKRKVKKRDKNKCVYCGYRRLWRIFFWRKDLEWGHVVPHSMSGTNCEQNIQLECFKCNRTKGAKLRHLSWYKRWTRKEAKGCMNRKCKH